MASGFYPVHWIHGMHPCHNQGAERYILNIQLTISFSSLHPWNRATPAPGLTGWALPAFHRSWDGESYKLYGGWCDNVACGARIQSLLALVWSFVSTVWKSCSTARCSSPLSPPARIRTDRTFAPPWGWVLLSHVCLAPLGMPGGREDAPGPTRMLSCLRGTGVRPGHIRGGHSEERGWEC